MRIKFCLVFLASIMAAAGTRVSASESSVFISLTDSLDPLKNAFNVDSAKLRLVAILSPT